MLRGAGCQRDFPGPKKCVETAYKSRKPVAEANLSVGVDSNLGAPLLDFQGYVLTAFDGPELPRA